MDWEELNSLEEFRAWVEGQTSIRFSYKVGTFNGHQEHFDGIGHFFHHFFPKAPSTRTDPPVETPLGKLTYQTLILEPAILYEAVGKSARQGDILEHRPELFGSENPQPTHWIILRAGLKSLHKATLRSIRRIIAI